MITIAFDEVCKSCGGTGLYVGMAERNDSAVVCHTCKGTGCHHFKYEYEEFSHRKDIRNIKRVFRVNPGICIGEGDRYQLTDFGGMPFKEWEAGLTFPDKSENRLFTCPAWWYQSDSSKEKPDWNECGWGAFSACEHFNSKDKCWEKWDKEDGQ